MVAASAVLATTRAVAAIARPAVAETVAARTRRRGERFIADAFQRWSGTGGYGYAGAGKP